MIEQSSSLLEGLNKEQREAVLATDGPVLVVAGPGSGKTRVLTHRIAYLIHELGVLPDRILAVTFTNKAAREMRERIERLLGAQATAGLVMGTFHSLGVRLLRQNPGIVADRLGILPNFLIYDDGDQLALAKQAIVSVGLDPKQIAPRRMLGRISAAKGLFLSPGDIAVDAATYDDELVARVYREYDRTLRKANAVDFDDLLVLPIRLFDEAPVLLERYQERFLHILVDEYQDTNRVQYVLVSALAGKHRNLFVVGDPDQSIYGWRQADIRNILEFEQDFPDATRIDLELNYRSTGRIVDAADRVIRVNTKRIDRRLRTENADGSPVVVRELADQQHEAQFVVAEIRRLIQSQRLTGNHFAVMYRTTAQSRVLEEAFRISDVPYRIVGGVRFYERKEVKDVLAVLRLLHNPNDDVSLTRVLDNTPIGRGLGPKAIDAVTAWATLHGVSMLEAFLRMSPAVTMDGDAPQLSGASRSAAQRVGSVFAALRDQVGHLALAELFDAVVERTGYKDSFNEDVEEEMERWANLLELRTDLEKFDVVEPGEALATYLEQVALISDVDTMEDDPRGRVTLITLHSAKGLEFPVVFIVGVEDGLLPISRAVEAEFTDPMPMEEERRLFYVGITRAMNQLYVLYAANRMSYGRYQSGLPSRFLASLPSENVTTLSRSSRRAGATLRDRVRAGERAADVWGSPSRAVEAPPKVVLPDYQPGQRVFHNKFGEGTIVEVVKRPDDQELAVDFQRHGQKRLMASFANLDLIE